MEDAIGLDGRAPSGDDAMETSVTLSVERGRAPVDVVENLDGSLRDQEERYRVGDPHLALRRMRQ